MSDKPENWMSRPGVDSMQWPERITIRPVEVRVSRWPYPWCRQKDKCAGKGSCPLDPNCGE